MKNRHHKFLIVLGLIFGGLFIACKMFAFDCPADGYWKEGRCYMSGGYYKFSKEMQCNTDVTYNTNEPARIALNRQMFDKTNEIERLKQQLNNAENELKAIEKNITMLPLIEYKNNVCKEVETPMFVSIEIKTIYKTIVKEVLPKTGA